VSAVTRILCAVEQGHHHAAPELLRLVYDELRKLAAQKPAREKAGQTPQATVVVHEAYLRPVGTEQAQAWNSRGHFFAAAAQAHSRRATPSERERHRPPGCRARPAICSPRPSVRSEHPR
jgi:hypothetical protein